MTDNAFALTFSSLDYGKTLEISIKPDNPLPNQPITATITSYSFAINEANITWKLNGKIISQGTGKKDATLSAGNIGSQLVLSVYVVSKEGKYVEKTITIKISDVDLLWEANTYIPPFYKGKAKPVWGTDVKITAITNGLGERKKLIYDWEKNYKKDVNASGMGKDSYTLFLNGEADHETVQLTVTDPISGYSTKKKLNIWPDEVEIVFYEETKEGNIIFQKTLDKEIFLEKRDLIVRVEPYYIPIAKINQAETDWKLNNKTISNFTKPNNTGISVPENTHGQAFLSLNISGIMENFLQQISGSITLNY